MKKSFVALSVVLALGCALFAPIFVHTSLDVLNIPAVFGILFGSSLLFLAFSDYSRKPRFRARGVPNTSAAATSPATSPEVEAASAWTYTTFSA